MFSLNIFIFSSELVPSSIPSPNQTLNTSLPLSVGLVPAGTAAEMAAGTAAGTAAETAAGAAAETVATAGTGAAAEVNLSDSGPSKPRETRHTQPKWLESLQQNFSAQIIEQCSAKTKKAVEKNEKVEVMKASCLCLCIVLLL